MNTKCAFLNLVGCRMVGWVVEKSWWACIDTCNKCLRYTKTWLIFTLMYKQCLNHSIVVPIHPFTSKNIIGMTETTLYTNMYITCHGHIHHCQHSTHLAIFLGGGMGGGLDTSNRVGGIVLVLFNGKKHELKIHYCNQPYQPTRIRTAQSPGSKCIAMVESVLHA